MSKAVKLAIAADDELPEFIVAEVSTNWPKPWPVGPNELIAAKFEDVINVNCKRGYKLHSFQLFRLLVDVEQMNETIVAVFEKVSQ